jgi:hypothetical protein
MDESPPSGAARPVATRSGALTAVLDLLPRGGALPWLGVNARSAMATLGLVCSAAILVYLSSCTSTTS